MNFIYFLAKYTSQYIAAPATSRHTNSQPRARWQSSSRRVSGANRRAPHCFPLFSFRSPLFGSAAPIHGRLAAAARRSSPSSDAARVRAA
jgi:hypothetical protein